MILATLVMSLPVEAQHGGHGGSPRPTRKAGTPPAQTVYQPQESAGEVRLTLAPRWSDGKLIVLLAANTPSVDLSQVNLQQAVRLLVNGEVVAPTSADSLKGHHGRARIVFPLPKGPEQFTIEVRGVPDVDVRVIQWPMQYPSGH